jgi:hypothetical protein
MAHMEKSHLHVYKREIFKRKEKYSCKQCAMELATKAGLKKHTANKHPDSDQLQNKGVHRCNLCDKLFADKYILKTHKRNIHLTSGSRKEKHQCKVCDMNVSSKYIMEAHMQKVHNVGRPRSTNIDLQCKLCDKQMADKYILKTHVLKVHIKERHSCPVCAKKLYSRYILMSHMSKLHPEYWAKHSLKWVTAQPFYEKETEENRVIKME